MAGNQTIDIESVLSARMNGRRPPKLMVSFLKRFLRIDFMNGLLDSEKTGMDMINHIITRLNVRAETDGLGDIPNDGRKYVFASNHPLGGIDGILLLSTLGAHFPNKHLHIQVNDFLMHIPPLKEMFIPVSKTGLQSQGLSEMTDNLYNGNEPVLVFPAGLCSRRIDGVIQDLPWKKTFISKSKEYGRWIVPVHFIGQNSPRFYRLAAICMKLKLKFNLAMTLLPDEVYRGQNKTFKVVFGKPIPPEFFDSSKTPFQWAEWMRQEVHKMN